MNRAADNADDPRRRRILEGAMTVFLAYGFARTTMDDIARAAEVSRPTLYLQFRNKADIFRALSACLLSNALADARAALRGKGTLEDRLMAMLEQALFTLADKVEESPHGEELFDMENTIAADIVANWREGFVATVAEAIAEEERKTGARLERRGLSPQGLAQTFLDTLEGMRARGACGSAGADGARRYVCLIALALDAAHPASSR